MVKPALWFCYEQVAVAVTAFRIIIGNSTANFLPEIFLNLPYSVLMIFIVAWAWFFSDWLIIWIFRSDKKPTDNA